MEVLAALAGGCLAIALLIVWAAVCSVRKYRARTALLGFLAILVPSGLAAWSTLHYLFVDEPRTIALIDACHSGDTRLVRELLTKGADPNAEFEGQTPLRAANDAGRREVVVILRQAGAKE